MKKVLTLAIALALIISAFSFTVSAADTLGYTYDFESDNYLDKDGNSHVFLEGDTATSKAVTAPTGITAISGDKVLELKGPIATIQFRYEGFNELLAADLGKDAYKTETKDGEDVTVPNKHIPVGSILTYYMFIPAETGFDACLKRFDGWKVAGDHLKITEVDSNSVVLNETPEIADNGDVKYAKDPWFKVLELKEGEWYKFEYTLGDKDLNSWLYGNMFQVTAPTGKNISIYFDDISISTNLEKPVDPGTDDPGTDDPGTDDPGTDDPTTPGTFDAGILAFAVMGLAGVAGTIVAKKRR